jgi:hypothetical protein
MAESSKELVNRVATSGLITVDLEMYFPDGEMIVFDIKDYLFMGMILKEKDFREALVAHDWSQYMGKNLAVYCSADAIIPLWAFMLVTSYATPFAKDIFQGTPEEFYKHAYHKILGELDIAQFEGKRIVIKGCSKKTVPPSAYAELTRLLQPIAQSIMFGEPCSTVPIFKKSKT